MDGSSNGFDFYEQIWKSGNNLMTYYPKVGYQVQMYALGELNKIVNTRPDNSKPKLIDMINRSKVLKSQYIQGSPNPSKEDFINFIKKFYTILRDEDSKGRVNKDLGCKYKILYDTIFAYKSFEPQIPSDFLQVSQICKKRYIEITQTYQINIPNSNFAQNEYHRRNTPTYNNKQNPYCQTAPNSSGAFIPQNNVPNNVSGPINFNYPEANNQSKIGRTLSNNINPYYSNQNMQGESPIRSTNSQPIISKPSFNETSYSNGNNRKTYVNNQNENQNGINENNLLEVNMRKYGELIKSNNMKAIIEIQNGRIETGIQLLKNSLNFTMN